MPTKAPPSSHLRSRRVLRASMVVGVAAIALATLTVPASAAADRGGRCRSQPILGARTVQTLTVEGCQFKDLDRDGKLSPFEDWRQKPAARAADLVGRLSLEQKAGLMVHGTLPAVGSPTIGRGTTYDVGVLTPLVAQQHINTFITRLSTDADKLATENNRVQELAEAQPFGIPVMISTDPRNGFTVTEGQTVASATFSTWPDAIGFGAIGDPKVTRKYADTVRQEYRAVGITDGLSPQADLATEPRWTRTNGTFGSDPKAVQAQVAAYVEGAQAGGNGLNSNSVATTVKHWVGYGAQIDGLDSHYFYGRYAAFPGGAFEQHIVPFRGAFKNNASAVMPTYSILKDLVRDGQPVEQVGAGFNTYLLQDVLRGEEGFKGVIVSDWGITGDCDAACEKLTIETGFLRPDGSYGMPWGVQDLTRVQRSAKAINAGVDQIGGLNEPNLIVDAVNSGLIAAARIDESAQRILEQRFQLGLFENPYVDPAAAARIVGNDAFDAAAASAQQQSLTLLQNQGKLLPLKAEQKKVWLYGINADVARGQGLEVVDDPSKADVALVRLSDPKSGPLKTGLEWTGSEPDIQALIKADAAGVPTVVSAKLTRPLVLTEVLPRADVVFGDYGISDAALLGVVLGKAKPGGHLPFELPSSMVAVEHQLPDVPNDSTHPLFPYGFGLSYSRR